MTVQPETKWYPSLLALVFVVGLSACQSAPGARVDVTPANGTAADTSGPPTEAADPSSGPLTDGAGRQWRRVASGPFGYAQALDYCHSLPATEGGASWQLPGFYQLARAPLDRVTVDQQAPNQLPLNQLPADRGVRLWTATAPDRLPLERLVIDPQSPFVKTGVDLRTNPRFHALCVALPEGG